MLLVATEIVGKLFLSLAVILWTFIGCSMYAGIKLRDYKKWLQKLFMVLLVVDILLFLTTAILIIWVL